MLIKYTYAELYSAVKHTVSALLKHGLKPGDRVAAYSSNCVVRCRHFISADKCPDWLVHRKLLWHVSQQLQLGPYGSALPPTLDLTESWKGKVDPGRARSVITKLFRFSQIQPTILFAVDAVMLVDPQNCIRSLFAHISRSYNGKKHDHISKVAELLKGLDVQPKVIMIHAIPHAEDRTTWNSDYTPWADFIKEGEAANVGVTSTGEIEWHRGGLSM